MNLPRLRPSWILLSTMVLIAALAGSAPAKPLGAGTAAPSLTLTTRAGAVSLDSLRGKVVLLDFWASWCDPCRKSFPWMGSVQQRYADRGLQVVAVNLDKTRDPAYAFLEKHPAPFTVAFDPDGKAAEAFRVSAMPSSFLIGRDGSILEAHAGFDPRKAGAFESRIQEACAR